MKSTIDSLNSKLPPATNQKCSSSQVCLVATMRAIYQGKTGQGKVGRCASSTNCDDSSGCKLARFSLPFGASYLECKVSCFENCLVSFPCFLCFNFHIQKHKRITLL